MGREGVHLCPNLRLCELCAGTYRFLYDRLFLVIFQFVTNKVSQTFRPLLGFSCDSFTLTFCIMILYVFYFCYFDE